jgi:hypothetical protein
MQTESKNDKANQKDAESGPANTSQRNHSTNPSYTKPQPEEGIVPDIARFVIDKFAFGWNKSVFILKKITTPLNHDRVIAAATVFLAVVAFLQWLTFEKQWDALTNTDKATHTLAEAALQQAAVAGKQAIVMQGQLDAMETDKRPWIRAEVSIVGPIQFVEWNGKRGINVGLKFDLKNYGGMPAVNARTQPRIAPHPGNTRRQELDSPQKDACDFARTQAKENPIGGIPIFPGETSFLDLGVGTMGIYEADGANLFSIYGCVDYSYSDKMRYGQTGFRMILGQNVAGRILGLPFIEGTVSPYSEPISPELLAGGYPKEPPKIAKAVPPGLIFRPDEGGNYAK